MKFKDAVLKIPVYLEPVARRKPYWVMTITDNGDFLLRGRMMMGFELGRQSDFEFPGQMRVLSAAPRTQPRPKIS